ncbi:hypothetical protein MRY87_07945 [bacterium]|nr:hypothetical protein [bacterium]
MADFALTPSFQAERELLRASVVAAASARVLAGVKATGQRRTPHARRVFDGMREQMKANLPVGFTSRVIAPPASVEGGGKREQASGVFQMETPPRISEEHFPGYCVALPIEGTQGLLLNESHHAISAVGVMKLTSKALECVGRSHLVAIGEQREERNFTEKCLQLPHVGEDIHGEWIEAVFRDQLLALDGSLYLLSEAPKEGEAQGNLKAMTEAISRLRFDLHKIRRPGLTTVSPGGALATALRGIQESNGSFIGVMGAEQLLLAAALCALHGKELLAAPIGGGMTLERCALVSNDIPPQVAITSVDNPQFYDRYGAERDSLDGDLWDLWEPGLSKDTFLSLFYSDQGCAEHRQDLSRSSSPFCHSILDGSRKTSLRAVTLDELEAGVLKALAPELPAKR